MDGDLQDPPEVLPRLVDRWLEGFDVVHAVRTRRKESLPKRLGYALFYRLLASIAEFDIPLDSGDFCLMDRRVVDALIALPERVRFVRGLRSFVGFRQTGLTYERDARAAGTSKYPFKALFRLAVDGLVSFSGRPLRLVTWLGLATATLAAGLTGWVFADAFLHQTAPRGWASVIVTVLFLGSVQMIALGILGEYVRLIFLETKGRPTYIVEDYHPRAGRTVPAPHRELRGLRVDRPS
jgi:dolichol-phosphate mannosyltransferase